MANKPSWDSSYWDLARNYNKNMGRAWHPGEEGGDDNGTAFVREPRKPSPNAGSLRKEAKPVHSGMV